MAKMLETESIYRLLQNTRFTHSRLCSHFFPGNNNVAFKSPNSVAMVTILDNKQTNPSIAAFGAIHVCANNQAYLMFCECDSKYVTKSVTVEECNRDEYCSETQSHQRYLKISNVFEKDVDYSGLPDYFSAFENRLQQHLLVHAYDQLVCATLQTHNMDVAKNITVDLFDNDLTEKTYRLYRDLMGFLIADKTHYFLITIQKSDLRKAVSKETTRNTEVNYLELNSKSQCHFFDYDSTITFMNRHSYLEFLYNINGISGVIAMEKQQPIGYALALDNQVVQCYAETSEIACNLIKELTDKMSESVPVTMFMRECDGWICNELLEKAQRSERIHRFHSRILPTRVKWDNVFLMNIGAHIF